MKFLTENEMISRKQIIKKLRDLKSQEVYTPALRKKAVLWEEIEELIREL